MFANEELRKQLRGDWDTLMEHIMVVNSDVTDRFYDEPLALDLDVVQDRLKIAIGERPPSTYTQGSDHVYFDLDIDTDRIAVITIRDVSEYMKKKADDPVWMGLLYVLRLVKTIEVPPVDGRDKGRDIFAKGLRELIFA